MNDWHLNDKAEEMRLRMLGRVPRCLHCKDFLKSGFADWCTRKTSRPPGETVQPNGDLASYCPDFIEKQPCPDSTFPPST